MADVMFQPARAPSRSSQGVTVEAKVMEAAFGDGYVQRTAPGLNSVKETAQLVWDYIPSADGQTILDFFSGMRGVDAFLYTIPPANTPRRWTCRKWSYSESGPDQMKITAEFQQVFDQS